MNEPEFVQRYMVREGPLNLLDTVPTSSAILDVGRENSTGSFGTLETATEISALHLHAASLNAARKRAINCLASTVGIRKKFDMWSNGPTKFLS